MQGNKVYIKSINRNIEQIWRVYAEMQKSKVKSKAKKKKKEEKNSKKEFTWSSIIFKKKKAGLY